MLIIVKLSFYKRQYKRILEKMHTFIEIYSKDTHIKLFNLTRHRQVISTLTDLKAKLVLREASKRNILCQTTLPKSYYIHFHM